MAPPCKTIARKILFEGVRSASFSGNNTDLIEKETITGKEFMEIYNKSLKKDELESVEANVEEDKEKTELSEAETVSEESSLKDAESQDAQKVTEKKDSEQTKQEE